MKLRRVFLPALATLMLIWGLSYANRLMAGATASGDPAALVEAYFLAALAGFSSLFLVIRAFRPGKDE